MFSKYLMNCREKDKYNFGRIAKIEKFLKHVEYDKMYDVYEDVGLSNFTDFELRLMKHWIALMNKVGEVRFYHNCGLFKYELI